MSRATATFVEDKDLGWVHHPSLEVHGGKLMAPIGFLHFPSQFKPAPRRKAAPKKARPTRDNRRSR